jgi:hypothetical protein
LYSVDIKLDPAAEVRGLVARLLYIPTRKEEIGVIVLCHIVGWVVNRVEWPGELKIEGRVEVGYLRRTPASIPPSPTPRTLYTKQPPLPRCSSYLVYITQNNVQTNTNTQHKSTTKKLYIACMIHNTEATKHGPIYNIVYYTHNKIKRK